MNSAFLSEPIEMLAARTFDELQHKQEPVEDGIVEPKSISTQDFWSVRFAIGVVIVFLVLKFLVARK